MTVFKVKTAQSVNEPKEEQEKLNEDIGGYKSSVVVERDDVGPDQKGSSIPQKPASTIDEIVCEGVIKTINKMVIRQKLGKLRHLVVRGAIRAEYLDCVLFPQLLDKFDPQEVTYNGGIAKVPQWKISCYLEVLPGGVPTADAHLELLSVFRPLLDQCNHLFQHWYRQQQACNRKTSKPIQDVERLMTFVTRYRPHPGQEALLKHVDGAGKVDGSVVVQLPTRVAFEGGGLTFWDGRQQQPPIHYDTLTGDLTFIDRAVWHQADPITSGERWALVIFYKVHRGE